MSINAGRDSKLQIGLESSWGSGVTPTAEVPFTSESLAYLPNYIEEDALIGTKTSTRMDVSGIKVQGDVSFIVKPGDYLGLLLYAVLGEEATAAQVDTSTAYDHEFTPIASGSTNSLPHIIAVVDRKVAVKGYVSCKVESFSLEASVNDYVRGSVTLRGYDEQSDELESLTAPTTRAFQFKDGTLTVDGANYADVTSFSFDYSNNLEDDLYTLGSGDYMSEIEPQAREITASLDTLYTSATESTREDKFKTGSTAALVLTFESSEEIESGYPYQMVIEMPLCYITEANPQIGGPDRITQSLSVKATEDASNEAVTITLRDDESSEYGA